MNAVFVLSTQDMPKSIQPNFVLGVEINELYIQAGLQDRVIQVRMACTVLYL